MGKVHVRHHLREGVPVREHLRTVRESATGFRGFGVHDEDDDDDE
jgi:hypothetical protein